MKRLPENSAIDFFQDIPDSSDGSPINRRLQQIGKKDKSGKTVPEEENQDVSAELAEHAINEMNFPGPIPLEDILRKQGKVKKLLAQCEAIDTLALSLESLLEEQTKKFTFQVDISDDPIAITAVRKIFKRNAKYIDKAMYKEACARMTKLQLEKVKFDE